MGERPSEPEVITVSPTVDALVELSRSGVTPRRTIWRPRLSAGVETLGLPQVWRRTGRGRGHIERLGRRRGRARPRTDLVVFDGVAPRCRRSQPRTIVVVGGQQDGRRRRLSEHLPTPSGRPRDRDHGGATVRLGGRTLRRRRRFGRERGSSDVLRPADRRRQGKSVAYSRPAPEAAHAVLAEHLGGVHGANVVHVSGNLANVFCFAPSSPASRRTSSWSSSRPLPSTSSPRSHSRGRRGRARSERPRFLEPDADADEMLLEVAKFDP